MKVCMCYDSRGERIVLKCWIPNSVSHNFYFFFFYIQNLHTKLTYKTNNAATYANYNT